MPLLQIFAAEEERSYGGLLTAVFGIINTLGEAAFAQIATPGSSNRWGFGTVLAQVLRVAGKRTYCIEGWIRRHHGFAFGLSLLRRSPDEAFFHFDRDRVLW